MIFFVSGLINVNKFEEFQTEYFPNLYIYKHNYVISKTGGDLTSGMDINEYNLQTFVETSKAIMASSYEILYNEGDNNMHKLHWYVSEQLNKLDISLTQNVSLTPSLAKSGQHEIVFLFGHPKKKMAPKEMYIFKNILPSYLSQLSLYNLEMNMKFIENFVKHLGKCLNSLAIFRYLYVRTKDKDNSFMSPPLTPVFWDQEQKVLSDSSLPNFFPPVFTFEEDSEFGKYYSVKTPQIKHYKSLFEILQIYVSVPKQNYFIFKPLPVTVHVKDEILYPLKIFQPYQGGSFSIIPFEANPKSIVKPLPSPLYVVLDTAICKTNTYTNKKALAVCATLQFNNHLKCFTLLRTFEVNLRDCAPQIVHFKILDSYLREVKIKNDVSYFISQIEFD